MTRATDMQSLFIMDKRASDIVTAAKVQDGIGLCLSGGGYRAMLYHVGALRRLNDGGMLPRLREVASVSGGSITAGVLALAWPSLQFDADGSAINFEAAVAEPLLLFSRTPVDVRAALWGLFPGQSAADLVAKAYDKHLFRAATLQDITDSPRFTFMATNLQSGSGWRFAKDYAADYRVGRIIKPAFALSRVVAASSAFPPFLSPARFDFGNQTVEPMAGADLHHSPYTDYAMLTDGGAYDNLGLERVWKRCRTILVSNAGRTIPEVGKPTSNWFGQAFRTLSLIQQQAENSRRRLLFALANAGQRQVAYWGIETPISAYALENSLSVCDDDCMRAARIRTRLNPFSDDERQLLLAVGYAGADQALRRHLSAVAV